MMGRDLQETFRKLLPFISLAVILGAILWLRPNAMSYFGFNLLLNLAAPVAFAALAQMFIMAASDIDLSTGPFVGLVTAIASAQLMDNALWGVVGLAALIGIYALAGALIFLRNLPSIVVTLGLAFVWQGVAVILLPSPGGTVPGWLAQVMAFKAPIVPWSVYLLVLGGIVAWVILFVLPYGSILRGVGSNAKGLKQAGHSVLKAKCTLYSLAGFFGVISGLMLAGTVQSGDALIAPEYTLLSIAAVILGGGEFVGGKVSPFGAVAGAATLVLVSVLLSFMQLPSDWQLGSQGMILLVVLSGRALLMKRGTRNA